MSATHVPSSAHDPRIDEANHPVWMQAFSYETRHRQVDEDLEAGRNLTAVLIAIVAGGLLLGCVGVIAALTIV
jgi:hypothetical protein